MIVTHDKYLNSLNASRTMSYVCLSSDNLQVNSSVFLNVIIVSWKWFNADQRNLNLRKPGALKVDTYCIYVYSENSSTTAPGHTCGKATLQTCAHTHCRQKWEKEVLLAEATWENTACASVWMHLCIQHYINPGCTVYHAWLFSHFHIAREWSFLSNRQLLLTFNDL